MLDLGWSELLIIGVVTLIVVGPKDLPKMLRLLGQYAGRARGIAREFQRSMDEAARQADIEELKDVKKGLDDVRDAQYKMQRDMGQSFLDNPPKKDGKKQAKSGSETVKSQSKESEGAGVAPTVAEPSKAGPDPANTVGAGPEANAKAESGGVGGA